MITKLIGLIALLATFVAGSLFGAYYHREIFVWFGWHSPVYNHAADLSDRSSGEVLASVSGAEESIINLPNLDEPLPLIYSDTLEENRIQEYLKEGAVVLPLGPLFGDPGNVVVTAHSSGTLAFGPYRQAFARLSELKEGEEFTVQTSEAVYTYRVYGKEIVWPHEVDKLPDDDRSTVTLVTCWPLWTNFKRLLVHSELIQTNPHRDGSENGVNI